MRHILSALLAMCFSLQSFASSSSIAGLLKIIDEHQYVMNVEWDQVDKNFENKVNEATLKELTNYMKGNVVTKSDLIEIAKMKGMSAID